jgi:hypothetical protein
MILNADDFGCVADGRWLRGVSIPAGSAVMALPAGAEMEMEVGASISIPGAADMHSTIEALPGSKEVMSVAIAAGSPDLTVSLTTLTGRFVGVHEGWRIAVDGAGPNGQPLVTDIQNVGQVAGGKQVLTLADPASTMVTSAAAIANDGRRAKLSDHARASVGPVQIAIRNRQVADAAMTVGSKVLRSDAARFSKLDVGALVTIEGAGHHLTTVQEVPDAATVVLADPAQRAVSDGSADVWRPESDSTPGLQAMLVIAGQPDASPVEIVFGPGVYDFTGTDNNGPLTAIGLNGFDGITLRGSGREVTVLRLMPEQDLKGTGPVVKDTHVLMARNCHGLRIAELTIHGAYLTMAQGGVVQMHGVFLAEGCNDVDLDDIEVFQSAGDGVRLLGKVGNPLKDVRVDRCRLIQNHRSGVAVQREVTKVRIRGCSIDMTAPGEDACIDLEPTGIPPAEAPRDIVIKSNTLIHGNLAVAVSLSGISVDRPARQIQFSRNSLTGGRIGGRNTEHLIVLGNTIDAGSADVRGSMMGFFERCVDLRVVGNQVLAAGQQASGITLSGGAGSEQVRVVDNVVRTAGVGVDITVSGSDVEVARNQIHGEGENPGIRIRTVGGTTHEAVNARDNIVLEFGRAGITVGPGNVPDDRLHKARITGNTVDRQEPIPQGLIGIELTGRADQWLEEVVDDNEIGAAIPVQIHGPG